MEKWQRPSITLQSWTTVKEGDSLISYKHTKENLRLTNTRIINNLSKIDTRERFNIKSSIIKF